MNQVQRNLLFVLFFEYGRKRALEVGEENIYDFSIGNPNVPAPDFVKQAIIDILNEMDPCAVHGYTVAPGNPEVREVLAKDINRRFGTNFAGKNFIYYWRCCWCDYNYFLKL